MLGAGEDATVLPGGVVRWTVQVGWSAYNEVYATRRTTGAARRSATRAIRSVQPSSSCFDLFERRCASLTQLPTPRSTLGPIRTDFTARVTRSAFALDIGLTSRVMLTARVPYEHTISEVVVDVNPRNELSNPARTSVPIRR